MKKIFSHKWITALLLISALVFAFSACSSDSSDDDDDSSSSSFGSSVTLPSSSGTNPFTGKTWGASSSGYSRSIAFTSSTFTVTLSYSGSYTDTFTYNYTYDTSKGLLYASVKGGSATENGSTYTFSSLSDYKNYLSSVHNESGSELDKSIASFNSMFNTIIVYKYEISSSDSSLSIQNYFNGVPTAVDFGYSTSGLYIETDNGGFEIKYSGDSSGSIIYYIYPSFSNGSFSGTMYKRGYDSNGDRVYSTLGTASGTYSSSGTGVSDCTITLKFTSLPDGVSGLAANTEYTLSQDENEATTLSLQ